MKKVITYGTFDLLHQGHINLLKRAKALGDHLIVGVTGADYDMYRGKLNIQQSVTERLDNVRALDFVDEVLVEEYEGQKIDDIIRLGVDVFVIGSDWVGKFDYLREYCEVVYLERTPGVSSTQLRNMGHNILKMGIVGTGRIANRFLLESKFVSGVEVEGAYDVNEAAAAEFAEKHKLLFYETDYERFLGKVNAVYIAAPHQFHYDLAKRALLAGKNVLCEKPMVLYEEQVTELFRLAEQKGLIIMEAFKTAYCPGFRRMVSVAKSGKIGRIINVDATFTKLTPHNTREMTENGFGGSVNELITYPLLAIFNLLGCNYDDINFISYQKENSTVDLFTRVNINFAGATASAKVGLGVKSEGDLIVAGTRGYIYVPAPWWKTEIFELRYENPSDKEINFYKFAGDGLRYELVEFIRRISENSLIGDDLEISKAIARVIADYHGGEHRVIS